MPLLVPADVLNIPYVKDIIGRSAKLRNRKWIAHEPNTIIEAETIISAKNLPSTKENFTGILDLLEIKNDEPGTHVGRKIFLKRSVDQGRMISNAEEIEKLMEALGFEIVENGLLNFEEQLNLYRSAAVVVGIHGAGLINLIFRYPLNCHLIEIFPSDWIEPHYYFLSNQLGYKYNCVVGDAMIYGGFYLNPDSFLADLKSFGY